MSNTKHTPGPWILVRQEEEACWRVMGTTPTGLDGCYSVADVIDGNALPQNDANARLIAAAPQLLEVLRELVSLEADGKHADESAIEVWERAAAFIAKATGE